MARLTPPTLSEWHTQAMQLAHLAQRAARLGYCPATSGNFSIRLNAQSCLMTPSGMDKSAVQPEQLVLVDIERVKAPFGGVPSAEAALHCQLYQQQPAIAAVLHTHSKAATVLSMRADDRYVLQHYELLKAFSGIDSHQQALTLPVIDNAQAMPHLIAQLAVYCAQQPETEPYWGYLIRGHGLYTWGFSVEDAWRHLEALEFLLECELLKQQLDRNPE